MRRVLLAVACFALSGCPADPATDNQPPDITLDVGSTVEYVVGDGVIRITATASDPEGGIVTMGVVDQPSRADFLMYDNWGVFSWDPLASDATPEGQPLPLVFWAEDDRGERAERVVNLTIVPGNGVPRFTSSPSILHNVDSAKAVTFDVTVRDDDSQRVALVMPMDKAPDGAGFTVTGDFSGRFSWEPTVEQLKYRVHSVTFIANDGLNPPVEQKVSILFKKAGEESRPKIPDNPGESTTCSFEDAVRHTPLGPQRGADDYRIEAYLVGAAVDKFDRLVLNWTDNGAAWNDVQLPLTGSEMTNENGVFVGTIPNPLLAAGSTAEIFYQICAIDDDSSEEDAILCGPSNIFNGFVAYPPGGDGACVDDSVANHTFDDASPLAGVLGWELHRGCGTSAPDYYRMELLANQSADVFFTYPFGQDVTVEMYDADRNVLPLQPSECSGFAYAFVENATNAPAVRYFRVIANDVPYQLSPWFYTPTATCGDAALEPNDTSEDATAIGVDGEQEQGHICGPNDRDVYEFFAFQGEEITTRIDFVNADGDLDLKLFAPQDAANIDSNGIATRSSVGFSDGEEITYTADADGVYTVLVWGYGDDNTYTLSNTVVMPAACMDADSFAPNQTMATAKDVPFQKHTGLTVCGGSEDWFSFTAFPNEIITITVRAMEGNIEDMGVSLFLNGSPEETGFRNGDKITLDVFPFDMNLYHLQVESSSDVTYELTLSFSV